MSEPVQYTVFIDTLGNTGFGKIFPTIDEARKYGRKLINVNESLGIKDAQVQMFDSNGVRHEIVEDQK